MTVQVDAFLADSVASAEGKLYVQGAGWNIVTTAALPARHPRLGVGLIIRVPYTATNEPHQLEVWVEDADGKRIALGDAPPQMGAPDGKLYGLGGEFNVGRPPMLPHGDEQVVPIAINMDGLVFETAGMFNVAIGIDGDVMKKLPLRVQQLAMTQAMSG